MKLLTKWRKYMIKFDWTLMSPVDYTYDYFMETYNIEYIKERVKNKHDPFWEKWVVINDYLKIDSDTLYYIKIYAETYEAYKKNTETLFKFQYFNIDDISTKIKNIISIIESNENFKLYDILPEVFIKKVNIHEYRNMKIDQLL